MKKLLLTLGVLALTAQAAFAGEATEATGVVGTKGFTKVCDAYHQIVAVAVEYEKEVAAPEIGAYTVIDYDTAEFREAFNRRDQSEAPVIAVYTNDAPEMREDKESVPGKYVIIELAPIAGAVEEDGIMKPAYNAGVCTWRRKTEAGEDGADWRRQDFSKFVITQTEDVLGTDGEVVSAAGTLPTLQYDELTNLQVDDFECAYFDLSNGNQMYYCYYLPEDYDESKAYPMVVSLTGGGGSYREQPNGDPLGGHLTRDRGAIAWTEADEDVIVLTPQQSNSPYKSTGDDVMEIVYYFLENYSVDPDRVYCIGSSAGGLTWSNVLANPEYASVFAAYAPCNTHFNGAQTMYKEEYDVKRMEETWGFSSYEDYLNPEIEKPEEEYYEAAKEALKAVVDNRIPVYVWHGFNDETAPCGRGVTTYRLLRRIYEEEGLSEEEIDDLVKIYLIPTQEFHDMGILSYHMASKVAVAHPEFIEWMLSQHK